MGAPSISTGVNTFHPPCFMVTPDKRLIMVNGCERGYWWDGLSAAAYPLGITGPAAAPSVAAGATGGLSDGEYTMCFRYIDKYGIPSNISPTVAVTAVAGQKFDWSSITASSETRVISKQLFRSLAGAPTVFYLVATIANATTTYTDNTLTDTTLAANSALPQYNPDGTDFASQFTPPPNFKSVAVMFQDRAFYAVDVPYTEGTISVSNGSATVTGTSTNWNAAIVGRYLYIAGDTTGYLVSAYGSATSLTLSANYGGTGGSGQSYALQPPPDERNVLYYSAPFDPTEAFNIASPEAVLATNQFVLQDNVQDDDELTALMPFQGDLIAFKNRHMYKVSFVRQPNVDMSSTLINVRGCLNQRCWTTADGAAYVLDQKGIYRISGGLDAISEPIGDLFREASLDWTNSKWWWAESWPTHNLVKFHVAFTGDTGTRPKRAIVFNYQLNCWWTESYNWELGGSAKVLISNRLRYLYGAENDLFYVTETGTLDGLDSTTESGTIRGTVTSATSTTLSDSTATFPTTCASSRCWVAIVAGTGKGQTRLIATRNSGTQITVATWTTTPDSTSQYVIGAIEWSVKFTPLRYVGGQDGKTVERSVRLAFNPTTNAATLDIRRYKDHDSSPLNSGSTFVQGDGISYTKGDPDAVVDLKLTRSSLSNAPGYCRVSFDKGQVDATQTARWSTVELRGYQGKDRITLYGVEAEGVAAGEGI